MKQDFSRYQLLPDENFEEDETLSSEELAAQIVTGLHEAAAWERDELALRVTVLDGKERIGPACSADPL